MIIVRSQRWPERDRKRRKYIVKFEYIKSILRSLISHSQWSRKFKYSFLKRFYKITRSHSISYCRNNCSTHRVGGSTYRFSRMSRYATKYYASWGYFVGIRRSSF